MTVSHDHPQPWRSALTRVDARQLLPCRAPTAAALRRKAACPTHRGEPAWSANGQRRASSPRLDGSRGMHRRRWMALWCAQTDLLKRVSAGYVSRSSLNREGIAVRTVSNSVGVQDAVLLEHDFGQLGVLAGRTPSRRSRSRRRNWGVSRIRWLRQVPTATPRHPRLLVQSRIAEKVSRSGVAVTSVLG